MATHWKKLTDPNFLGSWDFNQDEKRTLTIAKVEQEMVIDVEKGGTSKKPCTVAYFEEGSKPLILNKTNCKTITAVYGTPYIEEWAGKKITVHAEKVKAFGQLTDALRVLKEKPKDEPKKYVCADCGKEIEPSNGYTAGQIVKITQKKHGVAVCTACGKERTDAAKS